MWLYILGSIVAAFVTVESIPRLRRFSPAQACIFQARSGTGNMDYPGVKQLTVSDYASPIVYIHRQPPLALSSPQSSQSAQSQCTKNVKKTQGIVLYLHGNADYIISASSELYAIQDTLNSNNSSIEYHAIAMEYPGYGTDTGSCRVTDYCISDMAVTLLTNIAKTHGIYSSNIIVVGRSIGWYRSCCTGCI